MSAPHEHGHPRYSTHLNESDTTMWTIERDPVLRTTIVAVALLDRRPDWKRLRRTMARLSVEVPRFRQKVVESPLRMSLPRWVDDPQFDLDYHLRRVKAPAPANLRAVLDMAGPIAMDAFDKDRPLWEFTVVEGLKGGRAALIQKVHHSFTDGVGGMEMAKLFLDDTPDGDTSNVTGDDTSATFEPLPSDTRPGGVGALTESISDNIRLTARLSRRTGRALPHLVTATARDPLEAFGSTARTIRSTGKLLRPARVPLSPVMRNRGLSRRLEAFDLPLDALLAAAHTADSTLNDAFLAGIAGGMRRYHEHHGAVPAALRVTMPINLRRADDELGNNKFTPVRFALPVTTTDATERMHQLGTIARSWRREPALPFTELIAGGLNRLPADLTTSFFGAMLKSIDFVATNIPGVARRSYLAGAEVIREYAFAPASGSALSIALVSHVDTCCFGINIDTSAVPDHDLLIRCLRDGFDEVLAVADPD